MNISNNAHSPWKHAVGLRSALGDADIKRGTEPPGLGPHRRLERRVAAGQIVNL